MMVHIKPMQCQICHSLVYQGEEYAIVHTHTKDFKSCMLCAAGAERVGWWLTV
jgi:hypothetical protein